MVWCVVCGVCGVLRCGAVRCGAVRCGAVRCGAVRCVALRCVALRCVALRCVALRCVALRCVALRCVVVWCGAVRCGAVRCGAVRCGAVRCGAVLGSLQFAESGHPVFRGTSPLSRGTLKSRGGGKYSIHFNAEPQTAELLLRTIIAVNQLCIYGAVAKWCNSKSPPQNVEPQSQEDAVREVPPQLVTRVTKHKTPNDLARGRPGAPT